MRMTRSGLRRTTAALVVAGLLAAAWPAAAQISAQFTRFLRIRAFQTVTTEVWLTAGRHSIIVRGDGDTDLDLYVFDSRGRLLDRDDDETDYCVTDFFVPRSGYVTLRLRNLGRVYNDYRLVVR